MDMQRHWPKEAGKRLIKHTGEDIRQGGQKQKESRSKRDAQQEIGFAQGYEDGKSDGFTPGVDNPGLFV